MGELGVAIAVLPSAAHVTERAPNLRGEAVTDAPPPPWAGGEQPLQFGRGERTRPPIELPTAAGAALRAVLTAQHVARGDPTGRGDRGERGDLGREAFDDV